MSRVWPLSFLRATKIASSLVIHDLLSGIKLRILVNHIVGVGYFLQNIDQRFLCGLFDFFGCQPSLRNIFLYLFDKLLQTTTNKLLHLFWIQCKILSDEKSLVVPALFFKYSNAISTSHLLKLNRLPWISFLGRGVKEWARTILNLLLNAICFDWEPCCVRLPAW